MSLDLSVVIPAYNADKYIKRCINSVVTAPVSENYEVIIVNDGSSDRTEEIIYSFCLKYKQVVYVNQPNSGVSAARNTGIKKSSKKYIMFLDSDDFLVQSWWKIVSKHINNSQAQTILLFDWKTKSGIKSLNFTSLNLTNKQLIKQFTLTDDLNAVWGKIYNKEFIISNNIEFPIGVKIGEDAIFIGELLKNGAVGRYINSVILYYEDNSEGASYNSKNRIFDFAYLLRCKKSLVDNKQINEFFKKAIGDFFSFLRVNTTSYDFFKNLLGQSKEIKDIQEIMDCDHKMLSFRRKIQVNLYKNNLNALLYRELIIEGKLIEKKF